MVHCTSPTAWRLSHLKTSHSTSWERSSARTGIVPWYQTLTVDGIGRWRVDCNRDKLRWQQEWGVTPLTVVNARTLCCGPHKQNTACNTQASWPLSNMKIWIWRAQQTVTMYKRVSGAIGIVCGREGESKTASSLVAKTCDLWACISKDGNLWGSMHCRFYRLFKLLVHADDVRYIYKTYIYNIYIRIYMYIMTPQSSCTTRWARSRLPNYVYVALGIYSLGNACSWRAYLWYIVMYAHVHVVSNIGGPRK